MPRPRRPWNRVHAAIVSRFLAGDSLPLLAGEYALPAAQIARIVQRYHQRHDRGRLLARLVRLTAGQWPADP